MKKLCIVFPGRRYSYDRSLLYFSSRYLEFLGYEVINLHYDISREVKETEPLEKNIRDAASYTLANTDEIEFEKYDKIVFISKSIGTLVACNLKKYIGDRNKNIYQIMFTPLDGTIPFISDEDLIFCGDKDRFLENPEEKLQRFSNSYIYKGFTHSLEKPGDYKASIKLLEDVMTKVDEYMKKIGD